MLKKFPKNPNKEQPAAGENAAAESAEPASQRPIHPEIDSRLNAFIDANRRDFEYYTKVVKEDPAHAVRKLMLKDMFSHESQMKLVFKRMPAAQEYFDKLAPEEQEKIKQKLSRVNPFYHEKAFVGEVLRHKDQQSFTQNRREMMTTKAGVSAG